MEAEILGRLGSGLRGGSFISERSELLNVSIYANASPPSICRPFKENTNLTANIISPERGVLQILSLGTIPKVFERIIRWVSINVVYGVRPNPRHPKPYNPVSVQIYSIYTAAQVTECVHGSECQFPGVPPIPSGMRARVFEMANRPFAPKKLASICVVVKALTNVIVCEITNISHSMILHRLGQGRVERANAPRPTAISKQGNLSKASALGARRAGGI